MNHNSAAASTCAASTNGFWGQRSSGLPQFSTAPPQAGRGRGRHQATTGQPERRELRRPHVPVNSPAPTAAFTMNPQYPNANPEDLARGMAQMDPFRDPNGFNAGYGIPQPAPNVDGWSSGENTFDHSSAIPQQYSHSIAGGHHRGYQQQQPQQQHPHQGGGGYRGNNPRGGNSWRGGSSYRGHNQQMGGGGHYNVGATEFVPNRHMMGGGGLSASAAVFVPRFGGGGGGGGSQWGGNSGGYGGGGRGRGGAHHHGGHHGAQQHVEQPEDTGYDATEQMQDAIATLVFKPAKFDRTADQMVNIIMSQIDTLEMLECVTQMVITACLNEKDFRACGARLCDYLATHVRKQIGDTNKATFRSVFMKKIMSLHSEYLSNIADGSNSVTSAPQTSFTLFLGELYLQFGETLPLPDAEKKRVPELAEALRSLLSAHVKKGKDNLKIVEQTLQTAGYVLSFEERVSSSDKRTPKLDALFQEIEAMGADGESILQLRNNDYGLSIEDRAMQEGLMSAGPQARAAVAGTNAPTEKKSNAIVITNPNDSKPVNVHEPCTDLDAAANGNELLQGFEGDEGLTAEELKFMNEQLGIDDEDDIYEDEGSETGMNAEMEAAFEEFLESEAKNKK